MISWFSNIPQISESYILISCIEYWPATVWTSNWVLCHLRTVCFSWQPVMDEIKGRISKYMSEENSINRRIVVDHRIHCCIYFLSPFASGLVFSSRSTLSFHGFVGLFYLFTVWLATELSHNLKYLSFNCCNIEWFRYYNKVLIIRVR